jgi:hypothetical protein
MHDVRRLINQFVETTGWMSQANVRQALAAFQDELGQNLEQKLAILRANLRAEPVTLADLSAELRTRYVGKSGKYRILAYPSANIWEFRRCPKLPAKPWRHHHLTSKIGHYPSAKALDVRLYVCYRMQAKWRSAALG